MPAPSSPTPLTKRIRRHVVGRDHAFFAATAPGLEQILQKEIRGLPDPPGRAEIHRGGVTFTARLTTCYQANLHLRTAHRVLMRLSEFKADGFSRLRRRLEEIPWEIFVAPDTRVTASVAVHRCRLRHTGAVTDLLVQVVRERLTQKGSSAAAGCEPPRATVFVRGEDDRFLISLDSSGELLHRRGIKSHGARAPLRETLAAAALLEAGYDGTGPLLDPMCGSGTFSLEAALIARRMAPGRLRSFDFVHWPAFRPAHWSHIREAAEKDVRPASSAPSVFASDRDGAACNSLRATVRRSGLAETISVNQADFFDLSPARIAGAPGTLVLNPPYGRRLGTRSESRRLMEEVLRRLDREFRGWRLALVVPEDRIPFPMPFPMTRRSVLHGSVRLALVTGRIR